MSQTTSHTAALEKIKSLIQEKAALLGFEQCAFSSLNIQEDMQHFNQWLEKGFHGDMTYMKKHAELRNTPEQLVPGTVSVISLSMNYLTQSASFQTAMEDDNQANISRYALGKDYHKLMRKRLAQLSEFIKTITHELNYRVFVDSAPVLERAFAQKAGLGWIGKNTMLINEKRGSFFFLGEIFTNLPLHSEQKTENQCGECTACINICPTQAIVAPYQLNATRCISYLTIEFKGSIPEELRPKIGNRIYGCDDCQLICPWNRYAQTSQEHKFLPNHHLNDISLLTLFRWDESTFLNNMEGSPIRRLGYECWQRNIAVALGNCQYSEEIISALIEHYETSDSELVKEHIHWAIEQQTAKKEKNIPVFMDTTPYKKLVRTTKKCLSKFYFRNN